MAKVAQLAGNVPKAARRLGVRVSKLRTVMDDVQANARRIGFERETAIEAGFAPPEPIEILVRPGLVEVRDHGPGIAAVDLPHVLDRFYRAADARPKPGSGLGLAIVDQIVRSHGGTVEAANAPDGGALLTIRFPT